MWYMKVRRLIGTYPKAAIAMVAAPCAPLAVALFAGLWWGMLFYAGLFLWSCYVGCILGRAGLNINRVRWAAVYAWPIVAATSVPSNAPAKLSTAP